MRESTMVQAWLEEGEARGEARGQEKLRKVAQNFLAMGVSLEQVAQVLEMSVAEVQELLK